MLGQGRSHPAGDAWHGAARLARTPVRMVVKRAWGRSQVPAVRVEGREEGGAEDRSEVGAEGTGEDKACRERVGMAVVLLPPAAAGGFAQAEPASGAVAGTKEAMGVDRGLHAHRPIVVDRGPWQWKLADAGGQKRDPDPGQDQEPRQINDEGQARRALLRGPADEGFIPIVDAPGRSTASQRGQQAAYPKAAVWVITVDGGGSNNPRCRLSRPPDRSTTPGQGPASHGCGDPRSRAATVITRGPRYFLVDSWVAWDFAASRAWCEARAPWPLAWWAASAAWA